MPQRTILACNRLEDRIRDGLYKGRSLIRQDSVIDGGIYLGAYEREAIVVDSVKYPLLVKVYQEAKQRTRNDSGVVCNNLILWMVYSLVQEKLPFNEPKVEEIVRQYHVNGDGKISLSFFIDKKAGVCRHQALLAAFLLERFKGEGHLHGRVSVDRDSTSSGAHAWCRYTTSYGRVFILDPAKKFMGDLSEAAPKKSLFYFRDSDKSRNHHPTK